MNYSIVKMAITSVLMTCASLASAQECDLPGGRTAPCEYPKNYAEDYLVVANPPEGGFQTCWALHGVILRHNLIVIPGEPDFSAGFVDPVRHQMVFQPQGLYDVYAKNFDYSWKEAAHSVGVDYGKCVDIFGVAIFGDPSKVRIGDPGKNVHSGI